MGGALSHNKLGAAATRRRRRKTTSAGASTDVNYHQLTTATDVRQRDVRDRDVRVGGGKKTSRLLSVLIGRKSATVATYPADSDVISGSGAQCWHQQSTDSGYNEVRLVCLLLLLA